MYPTIETTVNEIISTPWSISAGTTVPETDDVVLKNGGKLVEATYVYADLADSSKMAQSLKKEAAAKIIKVYVNTATRILKSREGEIRSFDGDRVMAIFMGANKEDRAVRAALGINWAVLRVIRQAIRDGWSDGEDFCNIDHGIGVDSGEALIVRGGIRNSNDLISVGAAPNIAAKLSDLRSTGRTIHITSAVRDSLSEELVRFDTGEIWSRLTAQRIGGNLVTVYGTSGYWEV